MDELAGEIVRLGSWIGDEHNDIIAAVLGDDAFSATTSMLLHGGLLHRLFPGEAPCCHQRRPGPAPEPLPPSSFRNLSSHFWGPVPQGEINGTLGAAQRWCRIQMRRRNTVARNRFPCSFRLAPDL